jgi:predicted O-linked N-acetylglucosamine transferase (SPINDLY family)
LAAATWRRLANANPTDAGLLRQLGQALLAETDFPGAIEVLRAAIVLDPDNARAYNNLGLAQLRSGDASAAACTLAQAVARNPESVLAHTNLGVACEQLGQLDGARACFERALALDPHLSQARAHLSRLLERTDAAAARRERDRALESHAINLMTVRRHDAAIPVFGQLIDSGAELGYLDGTRFHCRLHCCDWSDYEAMVGRLEAKALCGEAADLPFSFFVYATSPEAQFENARRFAADRYPAAQGPPDRRHSQGSERLKIAYLSSDFHEHATAYLIAGLLESHDRSRFEVTALSYGLPDESAMRTRLESSVEHFVDVNGRSDAEVAELMRSLGVQIAVDLKGFTGGARTGIFALRPAPVQINFLGYPGTMGAPYVDYIVADRFVIPEQDQRHYAEKVIYLPRSYQVNDRRRPCPVEPPERAEFGLPDGAFVFCSFNNLYKITPAVFAIWLNLLREIDGAVLWLLEGTPAAMSNLHRTAAAQGIAPARLIFAPHIALADHLVRYRHADLFLDTVPCNAHTTASDALWMGVPVLTVTGNTFAGRVATSLLHAVGLPQLCTPSLADYQDRALRLARVPAELGSLKAHLELGRQTFPLFDTEGYRRHLEAAFERAWRRYEAGEAPRTLIIE